MKKGMKLLAAVIATAALFSATACTSTKTTDTTAAAGATTTAAAVTTASGGATATIGVAMPTKDLQRWNQDGTNMKAQLEAAGYTVDLQYAHSDVSTQVAQIENMIVNGDSI